MRPVGKSQLLGFCRISHQKVDSGQVLMSNVISACNAPTTETFFEICQLLGFCRISHQKVDSGQVLMSKVISACNAPTTETFFETSRKLGISVSKPPTALKRTETALCIIPA